MEEHVFSNGKWKWMEADFQAEAAALRSLTAEYPGLEKWLKQAGQEERNILQLNRNINQKQAMWGSLVYKVNPHDAGSTGIFHFFLSENLLMTGSLDFQQTDSLDKQVMLENMQTAETAVEGLMVVIIQVTDSILAQIDNMEVNIRSLLWKLQKSNGQKVLEQLMDIRHQLLVLKNLVIPVREIQMAVSELFEEKGRQQPFYHRAEKQLDRCHYLIGEYTQELTIMADIEEITASVVGNEVMKTLTVITLLFTPMSAWGAWWGMNFVHMPELNEKYAYAFTALFILINTLVLFFYIKKKGWLGDLLSRKNS